VGRRFAALFLAALAGSRALAAQADPATLRYAVPQLACAQFLETSLTTIVTRTGRQSREQTVERKGVWQFRAEPTNTGVGLTGWLDTLVLLRRSPETTIRPDTDGLIGGRYRGVLGPEGKFVSRTQPFVPAEVAEVSDMAKALEDFFPQLPPAPLHPGQVWADTSGLRIQRLADSALSGVPLYRYALEVTRKTRSVPVKYDTVPLTLEQISRERGTFVWHPTLGLLRRERTIVVETSVPASRSVPEPVRARVEQRIRVHRDLQVPVNRCAEREAAPQTSKGASDG
jgi:hypothetical protein